MRHREPWSQEEALVAKAMYDDGLTDEEIGYRMGRTPMGIRKAIFRYYGAIRTEAWDRYTVGKPIGLTLECKRNQRDAIHGSAALADSVNALLLRMDPKARATCLGRDPQHLPGTNCALKTCAVERLAA